MANTSFHTTFSTNHFSLSRAKNGSESGLRSAVSYRFGFNGKENDNEVKGTGNQQDYGMRIYDPRLGRFLSVDPLTKDYPWYTPYQFAGNKPIQAIDLDGKEEYYVTDYFNSSGELYKTTIKIVGHTETANNLVDGEFKVHRTSITYTSDNNATVQYTGTTVGARPTPANVGANLDGLWADGNEETQVMNRLGRVTVTINGISHTTNFPLNYNNSMGQPTTNSGENAVYVDLQTNIATGRTSGVAFDSDFNVITIDYSASTTGGAPANEFVPEGTNAVPRDTSKRTTNVGGLGSEPQGDETDQVFSDGTNTYTILGTP